MESEPKKQKQARRTFTDELWAGAVSLVPEKGKTMAHVARDLDLTQSTLVRWVEQAPAWLAPDSGPEVASGRTSGHRSSRWTK